MTQHCSLDAQTTAPLLFCSMLMTWLLVNIYGAFTSSSSSSSLDGYYFTQAKDTTKLLSRADFTDNKIYDTPLESNVRPNAHDGECIHYATHYRKFVGSSVYHSYTSIYLICSKYHQKIHGNAMIFPFFHNSLHSSPFERHLFCGLNFSLSPLMIHASTNVN